MSSSFQKVPAGKGYGTVPRRVHVCRDPPCQLVASNLFSQGVGWDLLRLELPLLETYIFPPKAHFEDVSFVEGMST